MSREPETGNQKLETRNLYIHFPFCRRKCSYCVLYSRVGVSEAERDDYVASIYRSLEELDNLDSLTTIYFGGGSPALCNLAPLAKPFSKIRDNSCKFVGQPTSFEFTIELHPLDVTEDKLLELRDLGVNRISMGVQSLDDSILAHMGRGYDSATAARAFALVKKHFDNAGIDLIVGYPGEREEGSPKSKVQSPKSKDSNTLDIRPWTLDGKLSQLQDWGLCHCSVYALQNERRLENVPDDETVMNRLAAVGVFLKGIGLERYEISNYAVPGFECRHNLAVWRGEDYVGLGDGASGRVGLTRTLNFGGRNPKTETVTPEQDEIERTIFRLRTREGLDASRHPEWKTTLERFVSEGLLKPSTHNPLPSTYFLTPRGAEVCDTILAELV